MFLLIYDVIDIGYNDDFDIYIIVIYVKYILYKTYVRQANGRKNHTKKVRVCVRNP